MMKVILAQPSIKRFQWELEVLLTNMQALGDFEFELLFTRHDNTVPRYLADKYGVRCFVYEDLRFDKKYIPSVRPYLLWQHFKAHSEYEQDRYLYIDADIIFREMLDFATLSSDPNVVVGSDCNGYIGHKYLATRKQGQKIITGMAEICGIKPEQMEGVVGIGAQIILNGTTADFWERAYRDSNALYNFFLPLDTDLQKWTAEMWAQQWGWVRDGFTLEAPKEMDFCRPTDSLPYWDQVKIMHNAGVTGPEEMFFKGEWVEQQPFGHDFSNVRTDKVSIKYVEAIEKVLF